LPHRPPQQISQLTDTPERSLAWAVITQAVRDAQFAPVPQIRQSASIWLTRLSPSLRFWCEIAGTSPERIISAAHGLRTSRRDLRAVYRCRANLSVRSRGSPAA
jgi:hypothetical protein